MTSSDRTASYITKAVRAGANGDKILATYADGTEVLVVKSGGSKYDRLAVYGSVDAAAPKKGYYFCRLGAGKKVKAFDGGFSYDYPKKYTFEGYPLVGVVTIEDAASN
jgi:hypothetical protein